MAQVPRTSGYPRIHTSDPQALSIGIALAFSTLLPAFAVLLGCWAGKEPLLMANPISRRDSADLVAYLVSMLALPTDRAGNPKRGELTWRVCRAPKWPTT
jgi:hypothetical protein